MLGLFFARPNDFRHFQPKSETSAPILQLKEDKLCAPMKKYPIFSLLAILLLALGSMSASSANDSEDNEIRWRKNFRLDWTHFKGKAERLSPMDALTESGISFSWTCDWRGFHSEIYALFVPHGSWVKDPTPTLLHHEQAHFDITEIHARKMRKFSQEHPNPCSLGKAGIDKASKAIIKASYDMQNEYDEATSHGQNRRSQKEWLLRIESELSGLDAFSE